MPMTSPHDHIHPIMRASQDRRPSSSSPSSAFMIEGKATASGSTDDHAHDQQNGLNSIGASRSTASRLMPPSNAISTFSEVQSGSTSYGVGGLDNTVFGKPTNLSATPPSSLAQQHGYRSASPSPGFNAAISPSPSPTPSGRGFGAKGHGPAGVDRYATSSYSPPSTADSAASGALHMYDNNASTTPAKSPLGASGSTLPAAASSNASPFAHAAHLPRYPHLAGSTTTNSTSGLHSRQSSGHASSLGGAGVSSNSSYATGAGLTTPSSISSAAAIDSGLGSSQGVSGLAASLARTSLDTDPRSAQMTATGSYDSVGAHSSSSSNQRLSSTRPSFVQQSFSDGVPNAFGGIDAGFLAGSSDFGQQLRLAGAAPPTIPVSLPTTGPLSASDPRTQLHINNLPYRVRWQDLKDLFRRAGTVLRADVSLTPDNRSRGFGTVLMATEDDARRACDMFKGFNWQGRTLDVKIDRSGTLLGVGVGQLNPAAALLVAGATAGRGVSPIPSSLAPFAGSAPFAPALSSSPNSRMLQQQSATQLPAGISPALLPFLGSSSRASIGSPMSHAAQPWPSAQANGGVQQQRALSLSAGPTPPSVGSGFASPFGANAAAAYSSPLHTVAAPSVQQQHVAYPSNPSLPQPPAAGLPQSSAYMGRVLFVGNLPFHCQWQDLKDLFRAAGNIQRADVALTADGKSRGFGTVLFASPEDAQNAVRIYHGYEYSGRTLKVHFDRFAQNSAPPSGALPGSPSQYTGAFAAANTPMVSSTNHAPPPPSYNSYQQQQSQHQQQMRMHQQGQARFFDAAQYAFPYQQQQTQQSSMYLQNALYGPGGTFQPQQPQQQQQFAQPFGFGDGHDIFNPLSPQSAEMDNRALSIASGSSSNGEQDRRAASLTSSVGSGRLSSGKGEGVREDGTGATDGNKGEEPLSDDAHTQEHPKFLLRKTNLQDGTTVASGAPHPGRITLPPQPAFVSSQHAQYQHPNSTMTPYSPTNGRMSVPMTPGMPGFTFHAVPETPPMSLQFLSPGLNGPFSPPLIASPYGGPATPGASSRPFNPMINPAPGAPIHFNNGGAGVTTPMASMMQIHQPNFNPMFPPIGMSYQPTNAASSSRLPQTPHWSQPRPPQGQQMASASQHWEQASLGQSQSNYVASEQGQGGVAAADLAAATSEAQRNNAASAKEGFVAIEEEAPVFADESGTSSGLLEGGHPFPLAQLQASALMQRRASTNSAAVSPKAVGPLDSGSGVQSQSTRWDQRRGSMHTAEASVTDDSRNADNAAAAAAMATAAGLGMHRMHGATSTEALARKIAQMSAEKALRHQQRDRVASSGDVEEVLKQRSSSSSASAGLRAPGKGDLSGSALDDSASTPGSAASEG